MGTVLIAGLSFVGGFFVGAVTLAVVVRRVAVSMEREWAKNAGEG